MVVALYAIAGLLWDVFSNWYHTPPEVCSQKFATLIGREKVRLCNREEKCALTEVQQATSCVNVKMYAKHAH